MTPPSESTGSGAPRADYGIDAPGVVRGLLLGAAACLGGWALFSFRPELGGVRVHAASLLYPAVSLGLTAAWMILSSRVTKLWQRDYLLDSLRLRGDEKVLDAGCGRGLLLLGAARRLSSGKAVGVDLWQTQDQSGNARTATLANARAEGVADKIEVLDGDVRKLPFPDATFQAVCSSLVLHNIPTAAGRAEAVRELWRVLSPGGRLALCDIGYTAAYADELRRLGADALHRSGPQLRIFPPVRTVLATKQP